MKGAAALLFVLGAIVVFFVFVFFFQPPAPVAFIATGGFVLLMGLLIHALEPVFTAFAVAWTRQADEDAQRRPAQAPISAPVDEPLAALEGKKHLDPSELLTLVNLRIRKHEAFLDEIRNRKAQGSSAS